MRSPEGVAPAPSGSLTTRTIGLAAVATALAGVASAAGIFAGIYRDVPAMIDQAQAADIATLFVAAPVLMVALLLVRRGSGTAAIVVAGSIAYLAYTYAIFAFQVVVNPLAPVYIATFAVSVWWLALSLPEVGAASVGAGLGLPRRSSASFLFLIVVLFGGLWLSQIAGSATSGQLPPSVSELGVPTSAVYTLDLGFVLPVLLLAGVLLVRRSRLGGPLGLGSLVFAVLMALSILAMFGIQAARGDLADPSTPVMFGVIALVAAVLAVVGARERKATAPRAEPSLAQTPSADLASR